MFMTIKFLCKSISDGCKEFERRFVRSSIPPRLIDVHHGNSVPGFARKQNYQSFQIPTYYEADIRNVAHFKVGYMLENEAVFHQLKKTNTFDKHEDLSNF